MGGTRTEFVGFEQRGHGSRNAGQNRLRRKVAGRRFGSLRFPALLLFFRLERLPIAQHFRGGFGLHISENVGMAVNQFGGQPVEHLVDRKPAFVLRHLRVEQNLEQ